MCVVPFCYLLESLVEYSVAAIDVFLLFQSVGISTTVVHEWRFNGLSFCIASSISLLP